MTSMRDPNPSGDWAWMGSAEPLTGDLPYDAASQESIEAYAKRLVGHSLREVLAEEDRVEYQVAKGKGNLGDVVERSYFGINPGNISAPDFQYAHVELKTTPLKRVGKKLKAKERLVLQMIDYDQVHRESWETSSFLKKNARLLLLFYLWEHDADFLDYVFKIARLWSFPDEDLEIIKDDWQRIVDKVRAGKAHELSESDTLYLAACVKGARGTDRRAQPFSTVMAKPRAFSLKASYMNSVIDESLKLQAAVTASELRSGESLESLIHERFAPFIGKTADEIADQLNIGVKRGAKSFYAIITKRILGVSPDSSIAEFEKAGIIVRTMRLKPSGLPKEAVSFPAFDYCDLVEQEWENSDLRDDLTRRFFFVVYKLDRDDIPTLVRTQFWTMPPRDVEGPGRDCFNRTIELIMEDKADYLPKSTENKVCHVRPHGRDSSDTLQTPTGSRAVRKSFWLNQRYLAEQLKGGKDS